MFTVLRALALSTVAVGVLLPSTATAGVTSSVAPVSLPAGLGVKLLEGPADRADDPRAHSYIVDHLAPGTTITRKIGVSNGDAQPAHVSFYATAADIRSGVFTVADAHTGNDLTSWTTFSIDRATIQPGETLPVTVTIAVPSGATKGERYGAALAEVSGADAGNMTTVSRVGIRMYLSIGAGGEPVTTFTIDSIAAKRRAGNPVVTASVHNTGARAIDLSGSLHMANGPAALSAGPFVARTTATLAPGDSGEVEITLDGQVPNGPWDATVTLGSGRTTETATARITFPTTKGSAPAVVVVTPTTTGRSALFTVTAMAVVLLVVGVVIGLNRRRHRAAAVVSP